MAPARPTAAPGLSPLRRVGAATEMLFLYECVTLEPPALAPIAERLGLTVQATSHAYRALARRGLVERRDGRYRPTVKGVAWLHETLDRLRDDVQGLLDRLHVIRSTRAVALADLPDGAPVSLELADGLLSARPAGRGPSRGRVRAGGTKGALVEVDELEGIVPLLPGRVTVRTLVRRDLDDPRLADRLRAMVDRIRPGQLAAYGLEASWALRRATDRPVVRFAVPAAAQDASRLGVSSLIVVLDADLPRLLAEFEAPNPPPLEVLPLATAIGRSRGRPRGQ